LEIAFNDSHYAAGHPASYTLTIDEIVWNASNGCDIAGVNVTPTADGIGTACTWQGMPTKQCTSTSVNGSLKVTTKCSLPSNLLSTFHLLVATPTFYSTPTTLNEGDITFTTRKVSSAAGAITGNVVGSTDVTISQGSAQFITGNVAESDGTTLRQAVVKFTTAQAVGMTSLAQEFFSWILSILG
jgi:hypothetical protein